MTSVPKDWKDSIPASMPGWPSMMDRRCYFPVQQARFKTRRALCNPIQRVQAAIHQMFRPRSFHLQNTLKDQSIYHRPYGSKDPNRRYVTKTIITIPTIEILHTPCLGPWDPQGEVHGTSGQGMSFCELDRKADSIEPPQTDNS